MNEPRSNNVTWKWLAALLITVVLGGGSAWMTTMYAEVGRVKEKQEQDRATVNAVDKKVGVIEEQTKRTEKDVQEIKGDLKDQNKKLDELLRRVK